MLREINEQIGPFLKQLFCLYQKNYKVTTLCITLLQNTDIITFSTNRISGKCRAKCLFPPPLSLHDVNEYVWLDLTKLSHHHEGNEYLIMNSKEKAESRGAGKEMDLGTCGPWSGCA